MRNVIVSRHQYQCTNYYLLPSLLLTLIIIIILNLESINAYEHVDVHARDVAVKSFLDDFDLITDARLDQSHEVRVDDGAGTISDGTGSRTVR